MLAAGRRQTRAVLRELAPHLPTPWSIDRFIDRLAAHRGRPIRLVAWDFAAQAQRAPCPSGWFMPTHSEDWIFYEKTATPARRDQIIGHEIGHMLLDSVPPLEDSPDLLQLLAPSVSIDLARRMLARTSYTDRAEAAAEEFGTLLVRLGRTWQPAAAKDELGRLSEAL